MSGPTGTDGGGAGAAGGTGGDATGAAGGTGTDSTGVSGGVSACSNIWSYEGAAENPSGTAEGSAGSRACGASAGGAVCASTGAGSTDPKAAPRPSYPSSSGGPNGFPLACVHVVIAATRTRGALCAGGVVVSTSKNVFVWR